MNCTVTKMLLADIIITTKGNGGRPKLLEKSLQSLAENTKKKHFRLTVIQDGEDEEVENVVKKFRKEGLVDNFIFKGENEGLAPALNSSFQFCLQNEEYFDVEDYGNFRKTSSFLSLNQDDILYSPNWLPTLVSNFCLLEKKENLALVTGITSPEHPIVKNLPLNLQLKNWVRMTQLMGRWSFFKEIFPIPVYDPETRKQRAHPHNGIGSSVDWWICRNSNRCLVNTGRYALVVTGLLQHLGYKDSTWLKRELEETQEDLEKISRS